MGTNNTALRRALRSRDTQGAHVALTIISTLGLALFALTIYVMFTIAK
jgi:hypothetical protein